MKLSIITCTYNSETYLPKCIDSVIVQHLNPLDFEHIFVDGNSTDETLQIIQTYKKEHPEYHITVLQAEPKGIYNAMNLGVRQS
ncbi:MAG: glycosyltransferase [Candidatus Peribacteria bacterium]|jgi:glycosyltransferase involved in cell wall biosynthesis|nr:glycosyltransferase [Candidatus Peribacteria bacterium]